MKNIITIIVAIIIVFYAGMWSQKFLMEDECLDSGGSYNENGICNIAGSHQDVPICSHFFTAILQGEFQCLL
ncbi:lytic enzyme [Salmonella enterica subsp. enterica]|nr:lytic enzyme [Salmonella enterica subsp. enterica]